jgi:hypothetical protein
MRRLLLVSALSTGVALAGCAPVSGDQLTGNWPAMPAAAQFVPKAGDCHPSAATSGALRDYEPVDCTTSHRIETIHVATLTGAFAELSGPPELDEATAAPAFAECHKGMTEKFGRDWRDYRLNLLIEFPSGPAWDNGARWVRCDVEAPADLATNEPGEMLAGPLKDKLLADLLLGCFKYTSGDDPSLVVVPCTDAHNAEYVGSTTLPETFVYPDADADWDKVHDECYALSAKFVGVTVSALTAGVSSWLEGRSRWTGGDRSLRCYLWLDEKTMSTTAKGSAGRGIPS